MAAATSAAAAPAAATVNRAIVEYRWSGWPLLRLVLRCVECLSGCPIGEACLMLLLELQIFLLCGASLPALLPRSDEVVEQPALEVKARSDTDGEVVEVHAVAILV